jgi:predicted Rossmann fold flavoprotein
VGQSVDVCVIGAGPAGLMAGIFAARGGARTAIVEASTTAGRKLLVTGRGRCNITHDCTVDEFLRACRPFDRFLRHSIHTFGPGKVLEFFQGRGLATKTEPDGCIFPVSDRAGDVKQILLECADEAGVGFAYGRIVRKIRRAEDGFEIQMEDQTLHSRCVVLAAGGMSWPQTGTPRNGFELAQHLGHTIVSPKAALIPLVTREEWPGQLQGVGVTDTIVSARIGGKTVSQRGPLMFTEDGIGGPGVLNLSREITDGLDGDSTVEVRVDLMADMSIEFLEHWLIEQAAAYPKKTVATVLAGVLRKGLALRVCVQAGMGAEQTIGQMSKAMRRELIQQAKELPLSIAATRPIEEAIVTRGGVDIQQIDSKTMESRICPGLYFAGEVMNVDGPCGGYNLTIAFATGALAGKSSITQSRKDAKKE